jgi:WXXGXW repeat (2 copies)
MLRRLAISGALAAAFFVTACGRGYVSYAIASPPAPRVVGAVGVAPGAGFVWVDGFWDLRGRNWIWVDGRWARPPRGRHAWVPDRWERHGERWRYNRGHWR